MLHSYRTQNEPRAATQRHSSSAHQGTLGAMYGARAHLPPSPSPFPGTVGPAVSARRDLSATSLYVCELPVDLLEADFADAWAGLPGYKSSRLRRSRGKQLVGFVDFVDAETARAALDRMQGHKFPTCTVPIRA